MEKYTKEQLSILIRKNISKYRKLWNLTLEELADKSNLSHVYIRDLKSLKLNKTPSTESLAYIYLML